MPLRERPVLFKALCLCVEQLSARDRLGVLLFSDCLEDLTGGLQHMTTSNKHALRKQLHELLPRPLFFDGKLLESALEHAAKLAKNLSRTYERFVLRKTNDCAYCKLGHAASRASIDCKLIFFGRRLAVPMEKTGPYHWGKPPVLRVTGASRQ